MGAVIAACCQRGLLGAQQRAYVLPRLSQAELSASHNSLVPSSDGCLEMFCFPASPHSSLTVLVWHGEESLHPLCEGFCVGTQHFRKERSVKWL